MMTAMVTFDSLNTDYKTATLLALEAFPVMTAREILKADYVTCVI